MPRRHAETVRFARFAVFSEYFEYSDFLAEKACVCRSFPAKSAFGRSVLGYSLK